MISSVPLLSSKSNAFKALSVEDLVTEMVRPGNMMCHLDTHHGYNFTGAAIFRGKVSSKEVEKECGKLTMKGRKFKSNPQYFIE